MHTTDVYPSLRKHVLRHYQFDVFVVVSLNRGCPSAQHALPPGSRKYSDTDREECARAGEKRVHTDWARLYEGLVDAQTVSAPPNATRTLFGVTMPPGSEHKSTLQHVHKIQLANAKRKEWEQANGFRYDAVVLLRPDWVCGKWASLVSALHRVVEGRTNFSHSNFGIELDWQVSDKFVVASSEAFDYYAGLWGRLTTYWQDGTTRTLHGPRCNCTREVLLVGERMYGFHMRHAPFSMETFNCSTMKRSAKRDRTRNTTESAAEWRARIRRTPRREVPPRRRDGTEYTAGRGHSRVGGSMNEFRPRNAPKKFVTPPWARERPERDGTKLQWRRSPRTGLSSNSVLSCKQGGVPCPTPATVSCEESEPPHQFHGHGCTRCLRHPKGGSCMACAHHGFNCSCACGTQTAASRAWSSNANWQGVSGFSSAPIP